MKPVIVIQKNTTPLLESVNVSTTGGKKEYIMSGTFTELDIINRNQRIYTASKFLPCLAELNERINSVGVVYGEFDHPDVFDTALARASHVIRKASYVRESNKVVGEIKLLNTIWGKEAQSLVEDACPIFVSSRAAGVTENDGTVTLKKLFTYDIVADPGFASARMHSINESLGYKEEDNFRIYEMSDESKTNELFNMNKNDSVTKQQITDYSQYLIKEIASTREEVKKAIKANGFNPKRLEKLLEYYDNLQKENSKIGEYLNYLSEKVQIILNDNKTLNKTVKAVVNENKSLKNTTNKLIKYNDYLCENLQKSINYGEYLAEQLDKNISYAEYLAENLDKNIAYSEYIAENLDKNISYAEYLAENLDNSIAYSEYLGEHLDGNIAYSEYIAEHLDDNIAYSEYLAENVDKVVSYAGMITEKLNSQKINESKFDKFKTLEDMGWFDDECDDCDDAYEIEDDVVDKKFKELSFGSKKIPKDMLPPTEVEEIKLEDELEETQDETQDEPSEFNDIDDNEFTGESETELSKQIDLLIAESKKRRIVESSDLHFLTFLNKSQVDSYYTLNSEEQELVKVYLNENKYFSQSDVIKLIQESLSTKNESLEERVLRLMPDNIKPVWNQLNESTKKSVISQAKLYPDLNSETTIEHFWNTRTSIKKNESVTKKLVGNEPLIQEDKLSDKEMSLIMERINGLRKA